MGWNLVQWQVFKSGQTTPFLSFLKSQMHQQGTEWLSSWSSSSAVFSKAHWRWCVSLASHNDGAYWQSLSGWLSLQLFSERQNIPRRSAGRTRKPQLILSTPGENSGASDGCQLWGGVGRAGSDGSQTSLWLRLIPGRTMQEFYEQNRQMAWQGCRCSHWCGLLQGQGKC